MKLAVIRTGGKQYLVSPGTKLRIEKLASTEGNEVIFDQVLLTDNSAKLAVGKPTLDGVKVTAKRLKDARHDKIVVVKFKNKTRYRVKRGHRQPYTEVEITGGF